MKISAEKIGANSNGISWWESTVVSVYNERYSDLVNVAKRYMDTAARAEDVVQDALLRSQASGAEPRPGREYSYLRMAVLNTARDRLRHRQVAVRYAPSIARSDLVDSDWRDQLADAEIVWSALAKLPQRQREVLVLRHVHDMSEAETADALSVSPGSVKTHAARGRARMREELALAGAA